MIDSYGVWCAGLPVNGSASAEGGRAGNVERDAPEHRDNAGQEETRNSGENH